MLNWYKKNYQTQKKGVALRRPESGQIYREGGGRTHTLLRAHDPKSCLSANSSTSPAAELYAEGFSASMNRPILSGLLYVNMTPSLPVIILGYRDFYNIKNPNN